MLTISEGISCSALPSTKTASRQYINTGFADSIDWSDLLLDLTTALLDSMRIGTPRVDVRRFFGAVALCLPGIVSGQDTTHFDVLRRPPQTVGTCLPLPQPVRADSARQRVSHLVMKSLPPGRSREMTVLVDQRGRSIGYSDMAFSTTGARTGVGTNVLAVLDSLGGVMHGSWSQNSLTYPDSLWSPRNLASLNAMKDRATVSRSSRPLNVQEEGAVRNLVIFLRARCAT